MLTNQVLQCFSKKWWIENPYSVLLTCVMVANSEYDYFAMFSLPQWAMMFCRIINFTLISTISFSFRLIRHTPVQTLLSPVSPVHFISAEFSSLCIKSKTQRPVPCSPVRPSPDRSILFQVVQSIITRQVLTLVTSVTRIWTGKHGEEKGQRSTGFSLLFLSPYVEAGNRSVGRR